MGKKKNKKLYNFIKKGEEIENNKWSHKHDFPVGELWNLNTYIARFIAPRLRSFKEVNVHGYPEDLEDQRRWHIVIDKMIYAFECMGQDALCFTDDENRRIDEGIELFAKYFRYLWD